MGRRFTAIALLLAAGSSPVGAAGPAAWIATWATSPQAVPDRRSPLLALDGQTVRERARISVGGARLRIRLSNEAGSAPVEIGAATLALADGVDGIAPGTIRTLTFAGHKAARIPAGAALLSDPVALPVADGAEVSISLYFPHRVAAPSIHDLALKRMVLTPAGDFTRAAHAPTRTVSESSILLGAILVPARRGDRLVAAFGDSITDGQESSLDADRSWPGDFVRRLRRDRRPGRIAVVNEGIAGNQLLMDGFGQNALARFDRDVLALPGLTHVVLLEGINDIGVAGATIGGHALIEGAVSRSPDEIVAAYRRLIARAHVRGVKIIGATMTPFEGVDVPGYYSAAKEAARQKVNAWILTSGAFDGVVDFDGLLRDPDHPARLQARYAASDHLHPNDAGYQAMADSIDLKLLR